MTEFESVKLSELYAELVDFQMKLESGVSVDMKYGVTLANILVEARVTLGQEEYARQVKVN